LQKKKSLNVVLFFFIFITLSLGIWQVIRLNEKKIILENIRKNFLDDYKNFSKLNNDEFKKVKLIANSSLSPIFLYQVYKGEINFKVIIPYNLDNTTILLVDKGFIKQKDFSSISKNLFNEKEILGYTKEISKKNIFTPDNKSENFYYFIDKVFLEKKFNKQVFPLIIVQTNTNNMFIKSNEFNIDLKDNHLQYAITWFSLSFLIMCFYFFNREKQK